MTATAPPPGHRIDYSDVLAEVDKLADPLVIPNLGTNTAVAMSRRPSTATFYLWGGMGLTHSIGFGVALAAPDRPVVVLDGDGSLLMGLNGLATIGVAKPANLLHVVIDNSAWGNTGGQPTHTAWGVRLEDVAAGCGYPVTRRVTDVAQLADAFDQFVATPACTMLVVPIPYCPTEAAPEAPDPVGITKAFSGATRRRANEPH